MNWYRLICFQKNVSKSVGTEFKREPKKRKKLLPPPLLSCLNVKDEKITQHTNYDFEYGLYRRLYI